MRKILIPVLVLFVQQVFSQSDSLSLEKAISFTLENNYGIVMQKKNVEIAGINNTWGAAGALPTVSFTGSVGQTMTYGKDDDVTSQSLSGSVNLNWVLFRGFSVQIQKKYLDEVEKLSQGSAAVVVENTIVNVTLAYYRVLLLQKNLGLAEEVMNLSEDRFQTERKRKELGASVTYDLLQAQNAYLQDKISYLSAKTSLNNAVRQLNYLMALPLGNTYLFSNTFDADTTGFNFDTLLTKLKENNLTLRNQYINLEMAKLDVKSAKSAYYPTVTGSASAGYSSVENDYADNDVLDNTTEGTSASVSVGVSYTLFNGGTRKQALKTAKIQNEIAEIEAKDMEYELSNQLAQEFELYKVRKEMLLLAKENLDAAELNLRLSKQKYESGAINSFNYRDIQQLYQNTAIQYQNAVYDVIESYYTLMRLTGGIIDEHK